MQLGFVIDHSKCIGCHACTVACKAENDVPLGQFRTWVKYTERGTFPQVRRSFAVLRCNQCTKAPCVHICPVKALYKRPDGIVDVDPDACIGCKACMQGCPYDALYINDSTGTAQKCHFCAHRTERGLAPACAVVCPTEAIVPGDFHDPASAVSRLRAGRDLTARKVEAGTGPNVLYREVDEAGIDPLETSAAGGYLWASRHPAVHLEAEQFEATLQAADGRARARTTYDVDHPALWGGKVSGYLFTKSLAAGAFLVLPVLLWSPVAEGSRTAIAALSVAALAFLALTSLLLVLDLKRPARFLYVLTRPNWSSWLARGSVILVAYGALLTGWTAALLAGVDLGRATGPLVAIGGLLGVLTASYTGWLFGQAKGRVLWMRRGLALHLALQAALAGAALALVAGPAIDLPHGAAVRLRWLLFVALLLHAAFIATEARQGPAGRGEEYRRVLELITRGPFAARRRVLGVGLGVALAALLLLVPAAGAWAVAGVLALLGVWVEEDILVRAGQALPIS